LKPFPDVYGRIVQTFVGPITMSLVLRPEAVESLREFVDSKVRAEGCDHSWRLTDQWATENGVDIGQLREVLGNYGGFCDCEVVLNLADGMELVLPTERPATPRNPWLLPPGFAPKTLDGFTHILVGTDKISGNNHHVEGEWVIPAPFELKPKKRIRKLVHYFIGLDSSMPAEVAYVVESAPISAADLVARVNESSVEGLDAFTQTEAAFILERIASMKPGTSVGVSELDKITDRGKHQEIRIHRVLVRR